MTPTDLFGGYSGEELRAFPELVKRDRGMLPAYRAAAAAALPDLLDAAASLPAARERIRKLEEVLETIEDVAEVTLERGDVAFGLGQISSQAREALLPPVPEKP